MNHHQHFEACVSPFRNACLKHLAIASGLQPTRCALESKMFLLWVLRYPLFKNEPQNGQIAKTQ